MATDEMKGACGTERVGAGDADGDVGVRSLGEEMRARRERLGLSLAEVADRAGCARSYLSCIENARRAQPPSEGILGRIERALEMGAGELLRLARWQNTPGEVKEAMALMNDQRRAAGRLAAVLRSAAGARGADGIDALHKSGELARLIARADPEGALAAAKAGSRGDEGVAGSAGASAWSAESAKVAELLRALPVEVPVINSVAAGYPAEFTDLGYPARVADSYVRSPDVRDPDAFAARVVGDSMEPLYVEGDIVVFSPARALVVSAGPGGDRSAAGVDCFVRLEPDHESTFKRVFFERDGQGREVVRLQPLNPKYAARVVGREQVAGCYAAVSVTRVVG
ncbi:MAG: helix-turn-helix domain-containing protein [Phycisphaerales bacterium]